MLPVSGRIVKTETIFSARLIRPHLPRVRRRVMEMSMRPAIAYVAALITFGAMDFAWLSVMASLLYRPVLGDILLENVRLAPAVAFYLLYPAGIVIFAVLPAVKSDSLITTLTLGALFGLIAYATYDLTNHATLKNWSVTITIADMVYGAIASGVAAGAAFFVVRWFAPN
jgi:uncharacterized membrane protein